MLVAVNGTTVTVSVAGKAALTYTYAARVIDGVAYGLNKGMVGMGSDNSRGQFDNVRVRVLPPQVTLDTTIDLTKNPGAVAPRPAGTWTSGTGGLTGSAPAGQPALAVVPVPNAATGAASGGRVASTSWLELTTRLTTAGLAGIAFDVYAPDNLKLAVLDVPGQRVLLGHISPRGGFVVDASVPWVLSSTTAYTLVVTLKGASASIMVNGSFAVSTGYNAGVVDGFAGLFARGSTATFSSVRLRTDDPAFVPPATFLNAASTGPGAGDVSTRATTTAVASALALRDPGVARDRCRPRPRSPASRSPSPTCRARSSAGPTVTSSWSTAMPRAGAGPSSAAPWTWSRSSSTSSATSSGWATPRPASWLRSCGPEPFWHSRPRPP